MFDSTPGYTEQEYTEILVVEPEGFGMEESQMDELLANMEVPGENEQEEKDKFQYSSLEQLAFALEEEQGWEKKATSAGGDVLKYGTREWVYRDADGVEYSVTKEVQGEALERHSQILEGLYTQGYAVSEFLKADGLTYSREVYFADEKGNISYEVYDRPAERTQLDVPAELVEKYLDNPAWELPPKGPDQYSTFLLDENNEYIEHTADGRVINHTELKRAKNDEVELQQHEEMIAQLLSGKLLEQMYVTGENIGDLTQHDVKTEIQVGTEWMGVTYFNPETRVISNETFRRVEKTHTESDSTEFVVETEVFGDYDSDSGFYEDAQPITLKVEQYVPTTPIVSEVVKVVDVQEAIQSDASQTESESPIEIPESTIFDLFEIPITLKESNVKENKVEAVETQDIISAIFFPKPEIASQPEKIEAAHEGVDVEMVESKGITLKQEHTVTAVESHVEDEVVSHEKLSGVHVSNEVKTETAERASGDVKQVEKVLDTRVDEEVGNDQKTHELEDLEHDEDVVEVIEEVMDNTSAEPAITVKEIDTTVQERHIQPEKIVVEKNVKKEEDFEQNNVVETAFSQTDVIDETLDTVPIEKQDTHVEPLAPIRIVETKEKVVVKQERNQVKLVYKKAERVSYKAPTPENIKNIQGKVKSEEPIRIRQEYDSGRNALISIENFKARAREAVSSGKREAPRTVIRNMEGFRGTQVLYTSDAIVAERSGFAGPRSSVGDPFDGETKDESDYGISIRSYAVAA